MNLNLLRGKVYECGLTMSGLAEMLGMNPATIHRKTHGQSDFDRAEMLRIRDILKLSSEDFERIFFSE